MKSSNISLVGKILVSSPFIETSVLKESIIYIYIHDKNGIVGIVINNRIGTIIGSKVIRIIKKQIKNINKKNNYPVLLGGYSYVHNIIVVSVVKHFFKSNLNKISITIYPNLQFFIKELLNINMKRKFFLIRGVSIWYANQLEKEINNGFWFEVDFNI